MGRFPSTVLWAGIWAAGSFLVADPAMAHIPFPPNCTVDPVLVGDVGGASGARFTVIPRDISYYPLDFVPVTIRFGGSDLVLEQEQEPGTVVDCAERTLERYTDGNGLVVFHPRFGGILSTSTLEIRANGVLIVTVPARSTDIDASGVTDLVDLSLFREALFAATPGTDLDFNLDGLVGLPDLDLLRRDLFFGAPDGTCP